MLRTTIRALTIFTLALGLTAQTAAAESSYREISAALTTAGSKLNRFLWATQRVERAIARVEGDVRRTGRGTRANAESAKRALHAAVDAQNAAGAGLKHAARVIGGQRHYYPRLRQLRTNYRNIIRRLRGALQRIARLRR